MLEVMRRADVNVYTAVVPTGVGLCVLWGYLVAECTLNSTQTSGIRWMSYLDEFSPPFKELVGQLLPSDTSRVKPGTAAHFLVKICAHLTNLTPDQVMKQEMNVANRKRTREAAHEPPKKAAKTERG